MKHQNHQKRIKPGTEPDLIGGKYKMIIPSIAQEIPLTKQWVLRFSGSNPDMANWLAVLLKGGNLTIGEMLERQEAICTP
jgi:hypothetical protein